MKKVEKLELMDPNRPYTNSIMQLFMNSYYMQGTLLFTPEEKKDNLFPIKIIRYTYVAIKIQ
jgi:hypothetical protein